MTGKPDSGARHRLLDRRVDRLDAMRRSAMARSFSRDLSAARYSALSFNLDLIDGTARMRNRHQAIGLEIVDGSARDLEEQLVGGHIAAAVYGRPDKTDSRVDRIPLFRERMMIAMPRDHRLAGHPSIACGSPPGSTLPMRIQRTGRAALPAASDRLRNRVRQSARRLGAGADRTRPLLRADAATQYRPSRCAVTTAR